MEPLRILIASDIHLGYMEKDGERGEDTFISFEEILQIAKKQKVDMILLGGDLFHIQRPSLNTQKRCIELLRKYCMGDDPITIQVVNELQDTFGHSKNFPLPNFEDPNLNVSLPVFSIHGNHDDPSGRVSIGAVEVLHEMGLVTYFGKQTDLSHVKLSPILIQKGDCKLALYGLGALPDERCHRIFRDGNISYTTPQDEKSWLKVMVVHQNRHQRQVTKYLPEKYLAGFPDLVVWGHEHEAMRLNFNTECNFYVFQPGSSVITALSPGEDQPKQVGLLEIHPSDNPGDDQRFKVTPIKLETVRRLYLKDVYMEKDIIPEIQGIPDHDTIMDHCERLIEDMITDAEAEHTGNPKQPRLPLIRLRVFYEDPSYNFNIYLFGRRFLNRVANPQDIVKFSRKRASTTGGDDDVDMKDQRMMIEEAMDRQALEEININDIIKEYFEDKDTKLRPAILPTDLLIRSVRDFVEKESIDALENALDNLYQDMDDTIIPKIEGEEAAALSLDFKGEMKELKEALEADEKKLEAALKPSSSGTKSKASSTTRGKSTPTKEDTLIELGSDFSEDSDDIAPKKGRGGGRATRGGGGGGGRGRGRGRGGGGKALSKKKMVIDSDENDDDDDVPELSTPRRSAPARSAKSSTKKFNFSSSSSSD